MRILKNVLLFGLLSIIVQIIVHIVLFSISGLPYFQATGKWYINSAMFVVLIAIYYFFRHRNNNVRPHFMKTFSIMFFVQLLTIIWQVVLSFASIFFASGEDSIPQFIPITLEWSIIDILKQVFIFAIGLPIIILTVTYLLDGKKQEDIDSPN